MSEHDATVDDCLSAYRDGDYPRCAALARELVDRRQAPFVVSQLLVISLQRAGHDDEANIAARWMLNALASKPWLKAMIQVTLGQEPPDLRPPDELARCQLLYYRGARCRTLGEDDRALDLFESAARLPVSATERELARHEANELAIVVDGEPASTWEEVSSGGAGFYEDRGEGDEDRATTHALPMPMDRRPRSRSPSPPPAVARVPPPVRPSAPPPAWSPPGPAARAPSMPPTSAPPRPAPVPMLPRADELVRRHATVRYYRRLRPNKLYPMLVVLSAEKLRSLAQRELDQAATDGVVLRTEEPIVIEPLLPGCNVYPQRIELRIGSDEVSQAHFQVLAVLQQGRVDGAAVLVRQGGLELTRIPLRVSVGRPTLAYALAVGSMAVPGGLELFELDLRTQAARSFGGYAALADQVFAAPWWAWSVAFVAFSLLAAWFGRPRQQTFWNIEMAAASPR